MRFPAQRRSAFALCLVALWLTPVDAAGQVFTTVEFSFSNPGARSMGFGGAFIALADDATAAFANPAGLIQLSEPELSLEGRRWHYATPYTAGGRASGEPTGLGIDTVGSPRRAESTADLGGVAFVSLVYPVGDWSFAFYQHQLLNFEMTQEIQGIFTSGPGPAGTWRGPIEKGFFDLEITTRAMAAGYRVSDRLSLGMAAVYFDSSTRVVGEEFLPDDDTSEAYFAAASLLPERLSDRIVLEIPEGDWGLALGFLWNLSRDWKLGGVYRQGPELAFRGTLTAGPVHPQLPAGTRLEMGTAPWRLPDVYGLGASYRSRDGHWAVGLDWDRVEYSTVIESLGPLASPGDTLNDADELHVGAEYAFFAGTSVVAVRLGAWHDPDHQVRNETGGAVVRAELVGGQDELHVAGGLGVAFGKLQLDLGIDLSERRDAGSLSLIFGF